MLHALVWVIVFLLLGVWTLGAWVSDGVVSWAAVHAGTMSVAAMGVPELPAWTEPWLPAEWIKQAHEIAVASAPAIDPLLKHAPAAAGWITIAVWIVWAMGGIALLVLGAVLSGLVSWSRRRGGGGGTPPAPSARVAERRAIP
ncbi:MAG: hypothetical protein AD742_01395 [Methylibium sp. NZG]|nr:MAG: hypothetical protein AD742_01395 [Methylibium sp. NZG]